MTGSNLTPLLLKSREDWAFWYNTLRSLATGKRVWNYIDPDAAEPYPEPTCPEEPSLNGYDLPAQESLMQLTFRLWEAKSRTYQAETNALAEIDLWVISSLAGRHSLIAQETTLRGKLKTLRRIFAPSTQEDKQRVTRRYHEVLRQAGQNATEA